MTGNWREAEHMTVEKEFCDCTFAWDFEGKGACGQSIGKTLPAVPCPIQTVYSKKECCVKEAACIPCIQVLGSYAVRFDRRETNR